MFNLIDKRIISKYENLGVIPVSSKFSEILISIILSGILTVGLYFIMVMIDSLILQPSNMSRDLLLIFIFCSCYLFFDFTAFLGRTSSAVSINMKDLIHIYCLDYFNLITPNKKSRLAEIQAYFDMNPEDLIENSLVEDKIIEERQFNIKKEELPPYDGLSLWIEQYSKSKAFKNLVFRLCENSKFGKYDASLLKWAKNIPLMSVSENTRLELLKYNKFESPDGDIIYAENIDFLFSRYSEKQIRTVFLSPFNGEQYFNSLIHYVKKNEECLAFPVYNRMSLLLKFMQGDFFNSNFPVPEFTLGGECKLGKVIRIENEIDLIEVANLFSNCAKVYSESCLKGDSFFYMIKSVNGNRDVLFHLDSKGLIQESKYKANVDLTAEDELVIKEFVDSKY
jgi:hypothetical protein